MRIALVLVLAACDAGQKPAPAAAPPITPPVPAQLVVAHADPWAVAETTVDAGAAKPEPMVDPDAIGITWVVFPPNVAVNGEDPSILQRVDIEVATKDLTLTTRLPNEFGSLEPYNQVACGTGGYPLESGELAKITFYDGGAGGYFVKRTGNILSVSEWSQTDGACENAKGDLVACPRSVKPVAKMRVKAKPGAKIVENIVEVDDKGARHPLDCELQDN